MKGSFGELIVEVIMSGEGWKKLPRVEMIPIPEDVTVPEDIPSSEVRIPSTYVNHDVEYENDKGKFVNENEATHLRFTGGDRRSDIVLVL